MVILLFKRVDPYLSWKIILIDSEDKKGLFNAKVFVKSIGCKTATYQFDSRLAICYAFAYIVTVIVYDWVCNEILHC